MWLYVTDLRGTTFALATLGILIHTSNVLSSTKPILGSINSMDIGPLVNIVVFKGNGSHTDPMTCYHGFETIHLSDFDPREPQC